MTYQSPLDAFVFHNQVSNATYDFVIYVNKAGIMLCARYKKDGSQARYALKKDTSIATLLTQITGFSESTWKQINQLGL